jgi:hypothetical protein
MHKEKKGESVGVAVVQRERENDHCILFRENPHRSSRSLLPSLPRWLARSSRATPIMERIVTSSYMTVIEM